MKPISAKFDNKDRLTSQETGENYNYIWFTIQLPLNQTQHIQIQVNDNNTQIVEARIQQTEKLWSLIPTEKWMSVLIDSWNSRIDCIDSNVSYVFTYENEEVTCLIREANEELESYNGETQPNNTRFQKIKSQYGSFFKSDLPKIAFYPINSYFSDKPEDTSHDFATILGATPYLAATVITLLCAAALAILAGLSAPFVLGGASLADCLILENETSTLGM